MNKGQEAAGLTSFRASGPRKHLDFIISARESLSGVRLGMTSPDFCFEVTFAAVWRMDYVLAKRGHRETRYLAALPWCAGARPEALEWALASEWGAVDDGKDAF